MEEQGEHTQSGKQAGVWGVHLEKRLEVHGRVLDARIESTARSTTTTLLHYYLKTLQLYYYNIILLYIHVEECLEMHGRVLDAHELVARVAAAAENGGCVGLEGVGLGSLRTVLTQGVNGGCGQMV